MNIIKTLVKKQSRIGLSVDVVCTYNIIYIIYAKSLNTLLLTPYSILLAVYIRLMDEC